jgi:S1-C subfamily serine protease
MRLQPAKRWVGLLLLVLAGCAAPAGPVADPPGDSVLPGTVGVVVTRAPAGVAVTALSKDARSAGLNVGDIVLRYNGDTISDPRQFNRLVVDSRPGTVARLHVLREGDERVVDLPVEQLDTSPRT